MSNVKQQRKSKGQLSKWVFRAKEGSFNRVDENGESQAAIWQSEMDEEASYSRRGSLEFGKASKAKKISKWEWVCDGDERMDEWMSHFADSVETAKAKADKILANEGWCFEDYINESHEKE